MFISLAIALERAQACTCAAPTSAAEGLRRSSAVFRGKVTEIERPFLDRVGLTQSGGHRVTFNILKQWKGAPAKTATLNTRLTGEACGFPFEQGKEYLVFVVNEPRDIQTGICTGTKNAAEATEEIQQLDRLVQRN
jgi:hypothetical protein